MRGAEAAVGERNFSEQPARDGVLLGRRGFLRLGFAGLLAQCLSHREDARAQQTEPDITKTPAEKLRSMYAWLDLPENKPVADALRAYLQDELKKKADATEKQLENIGQQMFQNAVNPPTFPNLIKGLGNFDYFGGGYLSDTEFPADNSDAKSKVRDHIQAKNPHLYTAFILRKTVEEGRRAEPASLRLRSDPAAHAEIEKIAAHNQKIDVFLQFIKSGIYDKPLRRRDFFPRREDITFNMNEMGYADQ